MHRRGLIGGCIHGQHFCFTGFLSCLLVLADCMTTIEALVAFWCLGSEATVSWFGGYDLKDELMFRCIYPIDTLLEAMR